MKALTLLKQQYDHMSWADSKVWQATLALPENKSDSKIRDLLYHLHTTQYAFLYIWQEKPLELPDITKFKSMADMAHWAAEYHTSVQSFLSDLDEQTLRKMIKLPWAGRLESLLGKKPEDSTQSETMIQVYLHSSYHRGQVNHHIRRSNSAPPLTDFIAWVWLGKPAAVWDDLFE